MQTLRALYTFSPVRGFWISVLPSVSFKFFNGHLMNSAQSAQFTRSLNLICYRYRKGDIDILLVQVTECDKLSPVTFNARLCLFRELRTKNTHFPLHWPGTLGTVGYEHDEES